MKVYALHGWAYSTEKWQEFVKELHSQKIELKMLYIPGLTSELKDVWDIDDYIKWLDTELPNEPVVLLGHSNGGRLALNFAWVYPDRVSQLILLDSAGVYHGGLHQLKRSLFKSLAKLGKKVTKNTKAKKILYKLARVNDYNDAPENMKQVMENMIQSDKSLNLDEISTPTSIIWGGEDKITPLTDGVTMHNRIQNSRFRIVDNGRHSPHFTHPEQVAKLVKSITK